MSLVSSIFPPAPTFTEKDLPSLAGRVYIVTGAATGVGYELAKMLYAAGGCVYIAARSGPRCDGAIEKIKTETSGRNISGSLKSLVIDLSDLSAIKPAVEMFLQQEHRLDVLVNNAGVMNCPLGSKGKQGHDLEMVTNCVGPYLFAKLLEPILVQTAEKPPPFTVRVVFVVALMTFYSPKVAMSFDSNSSPKVMPGDNYMTNTPGDNYMQTKVGGTWLADEFAMRLEGKNVLSACVHPGLIRTELQRNLSYSSKIGMKILFKTAQYGAYSELFAALSPKLKGENNGGYVLAWGRIAELPKYVTDGLKGKENGGTGQAKMFIDYCEQETKAFE